MELDKATQTAFDVAYNNVRRFHEAQQTEPISLETMPGVTCRRLTRAIGAQLPIVTYVLHARPTQVRRRQACLRQPSPHACKFMAPQLVDVSCFWASDDRLGGLGVSRIR